MIRDLSKPSDFKQIKKIHVKLGFKYKLPKPSAFLDVLVFDQDGVKMAVATRVTTELYMWADPNWETPGIRNETLKKLHEAMRQRLVMRGVKDVHTWLPPSIAKSFGSRLKRSFGWVRSTWDCWTRSTEPLLDGEVR